MNAGHEPNTAAEWAARLRSDRATPKDRDAYKKWLEASSENRTSATDLDQMWQSFEALEDDPMVQEILQERPRRSGSGWQMTYASRLAAGLLLCLSLAALLFTWRYFDTGEIYETASGEQRVVDLEDGSRLHLNVATRLEVALQGNVRDVRMVRGQAFFEVTPDPARPFVVTAGDKEITVVGTKFDVLLQEEGTRVTVIEGRVAVTSLSSIGTATSSTSAPSRQPEDAEPGSGNADAQMAAAARRLELAAGDAIAWSGSEPPSRIDPNAATAAVSAWRSGKVVFVSTPLRQAVAELDRYTPVKVRLASTEIGSMAVSGIFHLDRLAEVESLVFALENSLPIVVERRDDEILLLASD